MKSKVAQALKENPKMTVGEFARWSRCQKEVEIALLQAECKLGHKIVTNNAMRILNGR